MDTKVKIFSLRYMNITSDVLHQKLKDFFGFDSFKGDQEAIINNLIAGKNTFVLMF